MLIRRLKQRIREGGRGWRQAVPLHRDQRHTLDWRGRGRPAGGGEVRGDSVWLSVSVQEMWSSRNARRRMEAKQAATTRFSGR